MGLAFLYPSDGPCSVVAMFPNVVRGGGRGLLWFVFVHLGGNVSDRAKFRLCDPFGDVSVDPSSLNWGAIGVCRLRVRRPLVVVPYGRGGLFYRFLRSWYL